jgi:hypothetical protein
MSNDVSQIRECPKYEIESGQWHRSTLEEFRHTDSILILGYLSKNCEEALQFSG